MKGFLPNQTTTSGLIVTVNLNCLDGHTASSLGDGLFGVSTTVYLSVADKNGTFNMDNGNNFIMCA